MSSKSVQLHNIKNVLFVTDLHKRESDYSSIKNYREAGSARYIGFLFEQ